MEGLRSERYINQTHRRGLKIGKTDPKLIATLYIEKIVENTVENTVYVRKSSEWFEEHVRNGLVLIPLRTPDAIERRGKSCLRFRRQDADLPYRRYEPRKKL